MRGIAANSRDPAFLFDASLSRPPDRPIRFQDRDFSGVNTDIYFIRRSGLYVSFGVMRNEAGDDLSNFCVIKCDPEGAHSKLTRSIKYLD